MPFREPTRGEKRQVGCRTDGGKDEGLSVGEPGPRRAIRIHGMDARQSSAALTVYCSGRAPCYAEVFQCDSERPAVFNCGGSEWRIITTGELETSGNISH